MTLHVISVLAIVAIAGCSSSGGMAAASDAPPASHPKVQQEPPALRPKQVEDAGMVDKDSGDQSASDAQSDDASADAGAQQAAPVDREAAANEFCDTDCTREADCAMADANCMSDCMTKTKQWAGEFLAGVAACLDRIGCQKDDPCYPEALQALHPDFENDPLVARCTRLSGSCGFDEDLCPSLLALTPDALPEATSCLSLDCTDDIEGCLAKAGAFTP